eukprot:2988559-Pyramimonas_sp.AAC.1
MEIPTSLKHLRRTSDVGLFGPSRGPLFGLLGSLGGFLGASLAVFGRLGGFWAVLVRRRSILGPLGPSY